MVEIIKTKEQILNVKNKREHAVSSICMVNFEEAGTHFEMRIAGFVLIKECFFLQNHVYRQA